MEAEAEADLKKQLLIQLKQMDDLILVDRQEIAELKSEAAALRENYFTLKSENAELHREIEDKLQQNATSQTLPYALDRLKTDLASVCDNVQRTVDDIELNRTEERNFVYLWQQVLSDLPNEWFYQDDEVIKKMIEDINVKIEAAKADCDRQSDELKRETEEFDKEKVEREKNLEALKRFIDDLKATIIRLSLPKSASTIGTDKGLTQTNDKNHKL